MVTYVHNVAPEKVGFYQTVVVLGTVVWNVIGKHRRSRNICNVKSGRFPVHLGLDHTKQAILQYFL